MINRLVEATLRAARAFWERTQRHRRLGAVARWLRSHWLEAVAVASLVGLIVAVNPPKLLGVFGRMDWHFVVLMVPVTFGMYVARGLGWWVTLRRIGVRISMFRSVAVEIAGQVMIFMPTGDLARIAILEETGASGRGVGRLTGTIAFQELLYMTLVGFGVLPRAFSDRSIVLLVLLMTLTHAAIFVVLLWKPAYRWAIRTVERIRVLRRFDRQMREIRPAFLRLTEPRVLGAVVAFNAVAVVLSFLLFWLSLQAIGVGNVSYVSAAFVLALGHLLSGLSIIPAGVGIFEGLLTVLMAANGVPPSKGAAAGLLYRGFNDVLMAAAGAGVGAALRRWSSGGRGEERDRHRPTSGAAADLPGKPARRTGSAGASSRRARR